MNADTPHRPYEEWRASPVEREEDAANTFGYYLVEHCRDAALNDLPADVAPETRAIVEKAVDTALHNLNAMLEGFWILRAGPDHTVELALGVRVCDAAGQVVETIEISPVKMDLSIGYWKWKDRDFR